MRFGVFMAVIVFWVVTPCRLYIGMYQDFSSKFWANQSKCITSHKAIDQVPVVWEVCPSNVPNVAPDI